MNEWIICIIVYAQSVYYLIVIDAALYKIASVIKQLIPLCSTKNEEYLLFN